MLKKKFLKSTPYFAAIITGGLFSLFALYSDEKFYDLLINIAATFFAIPLLYLFYETAKSFSNKRLNREIFDYAKMQVDRELLSIINQLQKTVLTLEEKDFSNEAIGKFLAFQRADLKSKLQTEKYLGFQVFKHWEVNEKSLHELLRNPFILEKMEEEQVISIIGILKSLRGLESLQKVGALYVETDEAAKGYKIQSGIEMNPENKKFPDRYMLLKHLTEDKFVVYDFGDIYKYNMEKCLKYYKVNAQFTELYAEGIFDVLKSINSWLDSTGSEFVIDTKMFKVRSKYIA